MSVMLCNVRLNTEPGQVVQAILVNGGPEKSFDDFIVFTFLEERHWARSCWNIPPTSRKCPSHIWNDFLSNYANDVFVWVHHRPTLNRHKWTYTPEKLKLSHYIFFWWCFTTVPNWTRQDLTAQPSWSWKIWYGSIERKKDFHLKTALVSSLLQSNIYAFDSF